MSIYSQNRYQSSDLDFATYTEIKPIEKALLVTENHPIDLKDLKRWVKAEGFEEKFKEFLRKYQLG